MRLPGVIGRYVGRDAYRRRIGHGLRNAWENAHTRRVEVSQLRAVAFSDHHRGQGDGADDFSRCEPAYCAALGWYLQQGYELWLLGDVEELWQNRPRQVTERYGNVLDLEREFGERLWRIYGNHDLAWKRQKNVDSFLAVHLPKTQGGEIRRVVEALKISVEDGGEPLGMLFLAHGHQGTITSGSLLVVPVSRVVVRGWAALQRVGSFASTAPSNDVVLRGKHDRAMAYWADDHREPVVLVAGHTHRPVFPGTRPPDLEAEATEAEARYRSALATGIDVHVARAAWERARVRANRDEGYEPPELRFPSYFNTGCCSFGDGDVTGLEFSDGRIRLVRWLDNEGRALPHQLEEPKDLRDVLRRVVATSPAPD